MYTYKEKYTSIRVFYDIDRPENSPVETPKGKPLEKTVDPNDIQGRKAQVLKDFNDTLRGRLSSLGLPFNTKAFGEKVEKTINTVLDSEKIPDIAKKKFLDDLQLKMELFTKISKDDIANLRSYREKSLALMGLSRLEKEQFLKKDRNGKLVEMDEMDIELYYLRMILDANLTKYIEGSALGLKTAFEESNTALTQGIYNEPTYKEYTSGIAETDRKYGLTLGKNISKKLEEVMKGKQEAISGNSDIMLQGIIKSELLIQYGIKNPEFGRKYASIISKVGQDSTYPVDLSMMRDKVDGKIISMKEIYDSYLGIYRNWTKKEGEIRGAREAALTDSTLSKTKKWLKFEQLESEFSTLDQGAMEQKLAQSSKADFALAILQAAQITPALGDALGVNFDTRSAILGIDADGKKLSGAEITIAGLMGTLGLLFVGGAINKLRKGSKALALIAAIKKVIPTKFEVWSKEAGGLGT